MTRLGDDAQINKILKMISIRHLKVEKTESTIVGKDNDQEFFRASRIGPNAWVCSYTDTKTIRWANDISRSEDGT